MFDRTQSDATSSEQKLEAAWRSHAPSLVRFATALVGPNDAHDVVTTAFLRTTRDPKWTEIEFLDRYLMRAVRNEALNVGRQQRRRRKRDLAAVRPKTVVDGEPNLDVLRAVASLSIKHRSVVFLTYWEGRTEVEIANILGISRSSVHRSLQRSRQQLRKAL